MAELTSRERIMAVAEAIVDELGTAGLRIDAVAEQAAINKRMIYHYFGDREGLITYVLQRQLHMILGAKTVSDDLKALMQRASPQIDMTDINVEQPATVDLHRAFRLLWQYILTEEALHGSEYSLTDSEQRQLAEEIMRHLLPGVFIHIPKPVYRMQSASRS